MTETASQRPKYPGIEVQFRGGERNYFGNLHRVRKALRQAGVDEVEADQYVLEVLRGGSAYDHILHTTMRWVTVTSVVAGYARMLDFELVQEFFERRRLARQNKRMSKIKSDYEEFNRTAYDLLRKMEQALERQRREGKRYRKGDRVHIVKKNFNGPYYFEGRATVIRPTGVGGRHLVDFDSGILVERFIIDKAQENLGNELDRLNRNAGWLNRLGARRQ